MTADRGQVLLQSGEARLFEAGIEGHRRDAMILFRHALSIVGQAQDRALHDEDAARSAATEELATCFLRLIDARAARQPVSQIIGRRAFYEHDFLVTPDTLDPRPETETLVHEALKLPWQNMLDLGTGTGAILLSLLAARPGRQGTGTDISPAALDVARRNAQRLAVDARFIVSDWFENVSGVFDLIVSNPPYIAQTEMADLAPEVRDWEPSIALTDGADGLTAYRRIATAARAHLAPQGFLLMEIGWKQAEAVANILRENDARSRVIPDLAGHDRVVLAQFDG